MLIWLAVAATAAMTYADPGSATVGDIRVQALSPNVVRIERRGPRGFENAPTFMVQNRSLSAMLVPVGTPSVGASGEFNVTIGEGATAVVVTVVPRSQPAPRCWVRPKSGLFPVKPAAPGVWAGDEGACCTACDATPNCTSWLYTADSDGIVASPPPPPPPTSTCKALEHNTDVSGPQSIPAKAGQQLCGATIASCCAFCDGEAECTAFVLAPPSSWSACPEKPYCFLLKGYKSTHARGGSVVGTKGPLPPTPPPPPPTRKANCQLNRGYGELHLGGATFGCPRAGCDSAWSGRWQGGDLGTSFRQPGLTMHATVRSTTSARLIGTSDDAASPFTFPNPSALPGVFAVRDSPRFTVPNGGAIPQAHVDPALVNTSGYDIRNDADDIYLFVVRGDYTALKTAYVALTGPVPLLPDWAFGTWFTEWHNYSQAVAEAEQRRWRTDRLPLSVWGLDINWRNNGFGGNNCTVCEYYYNETNTTRLPNITSLFEHEHKLGLKVYFNDHPHGFAPETSPFEIKYRYDGLTSILKKGLDYWWYDPNWHIGIPAPFNLEGSLWGAHLYTSVLTHFNAVAGRDMRPLMLGISDSSHPAAHRYPVWWTGDDKGLDYSINSMVQIGVTDLKPYVHSDCGGVADKQTGLVSVPEYVRWSQHCALGAIHRYHGGPGHQPWIYNSTIEAIVRDFLNLRMKLMPTIIAAGARANVDATPIARRLDIVFPNADPGNSTRTDQYLLADDLLVAPCSEWTANGSSTRKVWIPPGRWQDTWSGVTIAGPKLMTVTQPLARVPMWHRRGGLVCTAPVAQTVEEQDWSTLGLEVFPFDLNGDLDDSSGPAQHVLRRSVTREGEPGGTTITMTQVGGNVTVTVDPSWDGVPHAAGLAGRSWVVRIHLLRHQHVDSLRVDDGAALPSDAGEGRVIRPLGRRETAQNFFPFGGPGSAPPSEAGNVVEIRLDAVTGGRAVAVVLRGGTGFGHK